MHLRDCHCTSRYVAHTNNNLFRWESNILAAFSNRINGNTWPFPRKKKGTILIAAAATRSRSVGLSGRGTA